MKPPEDPIGDEGSTDTGPGERTEYYKITVLKKDGKGRKVEPPEMQIKNEQV